MSAGRKVTAARPTNKQLADHQNDLHDCLHAVRDELKGEMGKLAEEVSAVRHDGRNRAQVADARFSSLDARVANIDGKVDVMLRGAGLVAPSAEGDKPKRTLASLHPVTALAVMAGAGAAGAGGYKLFATVALAIHHALLNAAG